MKRLLLLLLLVGVFGPCGSQARFLRGGLAGTPAPPSGGITGVTVTPSVFAGGSPTNTVVGAVAVATQPTMSVAPGGAPVVIASGPSAGTWSWGAISSTPPNYLIALNGVASGAFYAIQMAAGSDGVLYDLNATSGWYQAFNNGSGTSAPAGPPGPAFTGTLSLGGPDVSKFALSSSTLPANVVTVGVVPNGTYSITITPTQAGISGSGQPVTISLSGVTSTAASITSSNYTPTAGSTVTVTYSPGTGTVGPNDVVTLQRTGVEGGCGGEGIVYESTSIPTGAAAAPNGPGSMSFKIPNVASVEPQKYVLAYNLGGQYNCPPAAVSSVITVPPTLPAYSYPTAGIPSDVTAYPSGAVGTSNWPNPPTRVLTVCPAGPPTCQYSKLEDAINFNYFNPVDYTQIKIDCGTYPEPVAIAGNGHSQSPTHLWLYGHCATGALPHFVMDPASGPGYSFIDQTYYTYEMIVDNLEISNWAHAGASIPAVGIGGCNGDSNQWVTLFRNVYMHDMGQGIFKGVGECSWNFTMLNSHIARTGGQTGPEHGIYISNVIQAGNPTPVNFTAKRNVFEENYYGHLVKSHASSNIFDCNVFIKDYSEGFGGAKQFESEGAGFVVQMTNNLLILGPYWWDNSQSNFFGLGYAAEWTGGYISAPPMFMTANNNIFINDLDNTQTANHGSQGIFAGQYAGFDLAHVPSAWSNDVFVGPYGFWGPGGSTQMIAPWVNWCWDGGQQPDCKLSPGNGSPPPTDTGTWYVNGNTQVDMGCGAATNPGGPPPGNDYACTQDAAPNSKGNRFYSTRSTAAAHSWPSSGSPLGSKPNVDGGAIVGWGGAGLDPTKFPIPAACTQPIGNVAPPS